MCGYSRDLNVVDVRKRIRHSCVFGDGHIVIIDHSVFIEYDVFENRPISNRPENIRLLFFLQSDAFGVTTAFHVEYPLVRPHVFVIAHQKALGVRRQSRLSSTG